MTQFAVVTGASSGIGLELARVFAENDFELLLAAEDDRIHTVASELGARAVQVDLATTEGVEELARAIDRPLDAIAINAGVGVGGPFVETSFEDELNMIRLNVIGTVQLAKLVLPQMVSRGEGRVLFTASIASTMPATYTAVYGATKAFVLSFSEAVRAELKDTGVTTTALMPGPTETEFFERADMLDTKVGQDDKDDPAQVARQGFEAMMAGKDAVVGGSLKTRVQGRMNELLPEALKARAHGKMAQPESADKS
jgi:short-subunit dehydrogenase